MPKDIGNERVLTALAETVQDLSTVDLSQTDQPEPPSSDKESVRYVEKEEIGRGGLGVVVEAFDQDLRRSVALKRPRDDRMNPSNIARLVHEAQITAQLDHPNIPAVHTLGIDRKGRPFFTMTRLRGSSLAELLAARRSDPAVRDQLTTGRLLRILLQVGYAVAFAHDRGVLHRDLKPDNIVIGAFGEVRLMDWGIAKLLKQPEAGSETDGPAEPVEISDTHARPETREGAFVGTLGHAAPEQIRGAKDIDVRADVYALGALMYEMFSGRPPVVGESATEIMHDTLEGNIPNIKSLVPCSERLASIIHKALDADRELRYPDVMSLVHDVEALLEGRPVTAHDECALERAGRWYLGRSPRVSRLRNIDVDLFCWSCWMLGIVMGLTLVYYKTPGLHVWYWVCLVWGVLAAIPPVYTLLRKPRPDDPGALLAFTEGITTTRTSTGTASAGSAPTADPTAPTEMGDSGS